jgi:diguanylate cyclase
MASLQDARKRADTDALTGLSNRRAFERRLGAAVERSKQTGIACTLAICDIDQFKLINDHFGHETGDRVIKLVAENFEQFCSRKGDVFRFGGEEYVILFTGLPGADVFRCIEEARASLENRTLVHRESGRALDNVTFSAGIASLAEIDDPGALLRKADRALYQAKSQGRNCIRVL